MTFGWDTMSRLLWQGGFVFLIVGAADHFVQKIKHGSELVGLKAGKPQCSAGRKKRNARGNPRAFSDETSGVVG